MRNLDKLKILWLAENPCALHQNYRLIILKILPNLSKLDNAGEYFENLTRSFENPLPYYELFFNFLKINLLKICKSSFWRKLDDDQYCFHRTKLSLLFFFLEIFEKKTEKI